MSLVHREATLADNIQYMDRLEKTATMLARSSMCPETWRLKAGEPEEIQQRKVADLCIIGSALAELDFRLTINTLPQCYVVHGRPAFMAQLQITLAARHGCKIVPLDDESDDKEASVHVLGKDGKWHRVTVTMGHAQRAGWAGRNQNYKTMPDRMLMARAVTKAIGLHCPEAKFALPPGNLLDIEEEETGEIGAFVEEPTAVEAAATVDARDAKNYLYRIFHVDFEPDMAQGLVTDLWAHHGYADEPITLEQMEELVAEAKAQPEDAEVVEDGEPFGARRDD